MITGTISPSDYLNAQRLHRAKKVRWYYLAALIVFVIGTGMFFLYQKNIGVILVCTGIGALIGELSVSVIFLPHQVRRLHQQQKDLASPFTYQWDDQFLEAQGVSGRSKRAWKNYTKFKENEKLFLLYHSDNLFEMFPKCWFKDQAQIAEFRSLASHAGRA